MSARIDAQMAFLTEADKLKSILRGTTLGDGSRAENSGEHSWHIALYAMILAEHSDPSVDISRVIKMLLIHDLVEIDAGDNPIFGDYDIAKAEADEQRAADRIFGLLPADQNAEFRALWAEFETAQTADAKFAKSLDRFQPPNQNLASGGGTWTEYNVSISQIESRIGTKIAIGAPVLWEWIFPRIKAFFARNP